jgi:uncharacterized protein (DUF58 family)
MSRTPLGVLLTTLGALGFPAGLLVGSLAPAVAGLALIAFIEAARRHALGVPVQAKRSVPRRARLGLPFLVRVEVRGPALLEIEDEVPAGITALGHATGRGRAELEYRAEAHVAGQARWQHVRVRMRDPWGLWQLERAVEVESTVEIEPEPDWAIKGRRVGRRHTVQRLAKARRAVEPQPEVENVRPAQPFDRLRDIHWARSALMGTLHARQRERAAPRKVVVFLDAMPSMRVTTLHAKAATASRIALGVAAAARGAGVTSSLVAFHDGGVLKTADMGVGMHDLLHGLGRLPAGTRGDALHLEPERTRGATAQERAFLSRLAPLVGGTSAPPFEAALSLLAHDDPSFVVAILDGEVRPRLARVVADRLQRRGHDVLVIVPATGAHHVRRRDGAAVLGVLEEALLRRERLARELAGRRVPLLVATPHNVQEIVQEVARRAQ